MSELTYHTLDPLFDKDSKILILGSFPSVKSREVCFYYGNKYNRFWKMLEGVYEEKIEDNIEAKKEFLYRHGIALFDVIKSCSIDASKDTSIKDVTPNDIGYLVDHSKIKKIILNGNKANELFRKYFDFKDLEVINLPSTSPANARTSLDELIKVYREALR